MADGGKLRVLALGDLHGRNDAVARVVAEQIEDPPDAVILVGDLAPELPGDGDVWREPLYRALRIRSLQGILETLTHLGCPILAVPGNHDSPAFDGVAELVNVDLLGGSAPVTSALPGLSVAGIGGAPAGPHFDRHSWQEGELDAFLLGTHPDAPTLLVSHTPPFDPALGLSAEEGRLLASRAVRRFVEREQEQVRLCISGHLHRQAGVFSIGRTTVLCCGNLCPTRARLPIGAAYRGTAPHPEVEQHFLIELEAQSITIRHYRWNVSASEAMPPVVMRTERTQKEPRRVEQQAG